jgi:hypothetical protein
MLSIFSNIPIILTFGSIGIVCFFKSYKIKNFVNKKLWDCAKIYVSIKENFNNADDGYESGSDCGSGSDTDSETQESYFPYTRNKKEEKRKLYYSDENDNNIVVELSNNNDNISELCEKYNDMMLVTKKINNIKYFKRTKNPIDDVSINLTDPRIFLQVEIVDTDNNNTISIHKYLENYMIVGNKILDFKFVKWFMLYYTSKPISNNYIVKIFDKNINYIELTPNDYIVLNDGEITLYEKFTVPTQVEPPTPTPSSPPSPPSSPPSPPPSPPSSPSSPPSSPSSPSSPPSSPLTSTHPPTSPLTSTHLPTSPLTSTHPPPPPPPPYPKYSSPLTSCKKSDTFARNDKIAVDRFTDDDTDNSSSD